MAKFNKKKQEKIVLPFSYTFSKIKQKLSFLKWLDPFTYVDLFVMPKVKKVTDSEIVEFIVNVFFAFFFAWAIYSLLGFFFQVATPLVIVYSASMENYLFRGDVMALTKPTLNDAFGQVVYLNRNIKGVPVSEYASMQYDGRTLSSIVFTDGNSNQEIKPDKSGNVVVYSAYPSGLPIIHRAIVRIHALDGDFILTKGDNSLTNPTFDQDCGSITQGTTFSSKPCISFYAVEIKQLQGRAFFHIPKVGCVKLWLVDDFSSILFNGKLPRDFEGLC